MHRARRAFSLVEALVAIFLIVVALLPLMSVATSSVQLSSLVDGYGAATRIALSKLEELEAEEFSALGSGSAEIGGYSLSWVISDDASGAKVVHVTVAELDHGASKRRDGKALSPMPPPAHAVSGDEERRGFMLVELLVAA